jgi:hypothetical protein
VTAEAAATAGAVEIAAVAVAAGATTAAAVAGATIAAVAVGAIMAAVAAGATTAEAVGATVAAEADAAATTAQAVGAGKRAVVTIVAVAAARLATITAVVVGAQAARGSGAEEKTRFAAGTPRIAQEHMGSATIAPAGPETATRPERGPGPRDWTTSWRSGAPAGPTMPRPSGTIAAAASRATSVSRRAMTVDGTGCRT